MAKTQWDTHSIYGFVVFIFFITENEDSVTYILMWGNNYIML